MISRSLANIELNCIKKNNNEKPYTHIELLDIETPFKNILINKGGHNIPRSVREASFDEIVRKMWNTRKLFQIGKEYGPYWEFVMNLASIIPVEYMSDGPVNDKKPNEIIRTLKEGMKKLKFSVSFDNLQLKKPYLFPTYNLDSSKYTVISLNESTPNPRGGFIKYRGYVYSQDGGINVDDFRGLVIRVKNTGVGARSQNFLDYPGLSDSLYFKWTFGEIYVTEGLNESMNIDRATFKTADPEYGAFVSSLHRDMQKKVFESVQHRWRTRVKNERENTEEHKMKWRERSLTGTFDKKFEMIKKPNQDLPVTLSVPNRQVVLAIKHKLLESLPKKERIFLQDLLLAVAIARERYPKDAHKQEECMYNLLDDLISIYPKTGLKYNRVKQE